MAESSTVRSHMAEVRTCEAGIRHASSAVLQQRPPVHGKLQRLLMSSKHGTLRLSECLAWGGGHVVVAPSSARDTASQNGTCKVYCSTIWCASDQLHNAMPDMPCMHLSIRLTDRSMNASVDLSTYRSVRSIGVGPSIHPSMYLSI